MHADFIRAVLSEAEQIRATAGTSVSVDAVFTALFTLKCSGAAMPKATPADKVVAKGTEAPPAPWFTETLNKLKGGGEAVTIPRFLLHADRFPVKRMDQLNVARWLREAGYTPRKTGGQLIFDL